MKKGLCFSLILSILFVILPGCQKPTVTGMDFEEIDTSHDPLQTPCLSKEPIVFESKDAYFAVTPAAEYELTGIVVSKKSYSENWDGKISPFDLAIAWGRLAEPEYGKHVEFIHGYRWYHYRWREGSPVDPSYVLEHSANNHVIPANENVRRAVKTVKKRDRITLEGYLVNLKGTYGGRTLSWNTSLSRKDSGSGSCELFYVSKVRIENRVYE